MFFNTMEENSKEKVCCVCLKIGLDFDKLTKEDHNNISLLTKFRMCIRELLWFPSFHLCSVCSETLNIVHTFREQCLKSDIIRKEQKTIKEEQGLVESSNEPREENEYSIDAPDDLDDATWKVKLEEEELRIKSSDESAEETEYSINGPDNDISLQDVGGATAKVKPEITMTEHNCEYCSKGFNTNMDIRSHILMVHTNTSQWNFVCEICTKPFPNKSDFDVHMRRHLGEKKYSCDLCEKKFITKSELHRHTKGHNNIREHHCSYCDRNYRDKRTLKSHLAKIHGVELTKVEIPLKEPRFTCHFCPKAFSNKSKLIRHLSIHSGEKPFSCHICHKKFVDESYFKQHLKELHSIVDQEPQSSLAVRLDRFSGM